ncbi:helix-turn-helix transcriptional regulator [Paludibacterium paludis]|uniref:Transcriptional regulator n=1 Tax=Paludibacterium paludis TaxID=1225769 RepID=A0A918U7T3_9NEIS|nr:YafY family protein [Paludibacterium paludis]GGY05977.1 transcriptional regulator [Paludibacterium paludis]
MQILRRHRFPVSGNALTSELGISLRTLYRDIASLQAQGADIRGEPGVGYVLRPGYLLPPLMFTPAELEALTLGFRWVAKWADPSLTGAAADALAKISAVLPEPLRHELDSVTLLVGPRGATDTEVVEPGVLREAIRTERKIRIAYRDAHGGDSERIVWPFALGYFQTSRILVAWCELRNDFRHFLTGRLRSMTVLDERYPRARMALVREWRNRRLDLRHRPDA